MFHCAFCNQDMLKAIWIIEIIKSNDSNNYTINNSIDTYNNDSINNFINNSIVTYNNDSININININI